MLFQFKINKSGNKDNTDKQQEKRRLGLSLDTSSSSSRGPVSLQGNGGPEAVEQQQAPQGRQQTDQHGSENWMFIDESHRRQGKASISDYGTTKSATSAHFHSGNNASNVAAEHHQRKQSSNKRPRSARTTGSTSSGSGSNCSNSGLEVIQYYVGEDGSLARSSRRALRGGANKRSNQSKKRHRIPLSVSSGSLKTMSSQSTTSPKSAPPNMILADGTWKNTRVSQKIPIEDHDLIASQQQQQCPSPALSISPRTRTSPIPHMKPRPSSATFASKRSSDADHHHRSSLELSQSVHPQQLFNHNVPLTSPDINLSPTHSNLRTLYFSSPFQLPSPSDKPQSFRLAGSMDGSVIDKIHHDTRLQRSMSVGSGNNLTQFASPRLPYSHLNSPNLSDMSWSPHMHSSEIIINTTPTTPSITPQMTALSIDDPKKGSSKRQSRQFHSSQQSSVDSSDNDRNKMSLDFILN